MRFFVKREGGKITGSTKWPTDGFPEEIDDQDADYIAYLAELETPPTRSADARIKDGSGAVTRAEMNALKAYLRGETLK